MCKYSVYYPEIMRFAESIQRNILYNQIVCQFNNHVVPKHVTLFALKIQDSIPLHIHLTDRDTVIQFFLL